MATAADRLISGGQETTNWVGYFFAHDTADDGLISVAVLQLTLVEMLVLLLVGNPSGYCIREQMVLVTGE